MWNTYMFPVAMWHDAMWHDGEGVAEPESVGLVPAKITISIRVGV
jgi:hypothetical protein